MNEHFEGHGNHWDAFGISSESEIVELIETALKDGTLAEERVFEMSDGSKIIPFIYPANNPIQICCLVKSDNERSVLESFYPVMKGYKNSVPIIQKYSWENGIEGEISIVREDRADMPFFASFYNHDFYDVKLGDCVDVYLAGLAYSVEEALMEFDISEGPLYEMALRNFLDENPSKTKTDFPSVPIHMDGAVMCFPKSIDTEYEYRGTVLDAEPVDCLGNPMVKVKICIEVGDGGEPSLFANLYISGHLINDMEITVGKDIQGVMWLTGYTSGNDD